MKTHLTVGYRYDLKTERGNPFSTMQVQILDMKGDWVKYAFIQSNGHPAEFFNSHHRDAFLAVYELDAASAYEIDHAHEENHAPTDGEIHELEGIENARHGTPHEL